MFLFKRQNGYWYIGFYRAKKRVNVSTGSKSKSTANEFFRDFANENKGVRVSNLRLKAAEYAELHTGRKTVYAYKSTMERLEKYLSNEKLINISTLDLSNFIASQSYSNWWLNNEIAVLKKSFDIAVQKNWLLKSPAKDLKKLKVKSEVESFRPDELELFLNELRLSKQAFYYYAVVLSLNTAMRKGEICSLKWSQINFQENRIKLRNKITKEIEYAYFNADAENVFRELQKSNVISSEGYIWGRALNERNLSRTFNRVRDKLGLSKHLRYHSCRHTAITRWANSLNLHIAQDLARHSSPVMTKKYVHTRHEELKEAIGK